MKKILIALVATLGIVYTASTNSAWAATGGPRIVETNKTIYTTPCHPGIQSDCYYRQDFSFNIPDDGYISIATKYGVNEVNDQVMTLWSSCLYGDALAKTVYHKDDGSAIQATAMVGVSKGNYCITFDADARDYNFSFYINYKKNNNWETEINNSYGMADVLAPDIALGGALNSEDEDDYYVWTADYTGIARMTFIRSDDMNRGTYEVSAEDYNNRSLDNTLNITKDCAKTTSTSWFNVEKGRNYYLYVTSSSGNAPNGYYQIKVDTNKLNLKNASVYVETAKVFTGSAIKPNVIVKYNGKKLAWGKDFSVAYSNNTQIGTAYATIIGKGDYVGMVKKTFIIKPKTPSFMLNASMGKVYASWEKSYGGVSGYQISYSTIGSMDGAKSAALKSDKFSAGLKLVRGKKYYVRVRAFKTVDGKIYYSDWSGIKSIINK